MSDQSSAIVDTRERLNMPFYTVKVTCRNCDFGGLAKVERGRGSEYAVHRTRCPICDNRALGRMIVSVRDRFPATTQDGDRD